MHNIGAESLTDECVARMLREAKTERDKNDCGEVTVAACSCIDGPTVNELIQLLEMYELAGS